MKTATPQNDSAQSESELVITGAPDQDTRFEFGRNWASFLRLLNDERIKMARESLQRMLGMEDLKGRTYLDAGSGSGLFSLAAAQLGAESVFSFDYDEQSVACTRELRRRYFPDAEHWTIEQGDCLDEAYLAKLPKFDIVYSWGVLHHTGSMWNAVENVTRLVAPGGLFFTAIYNDQRWQSHIWKWVKRTYCSGPLRRAAVCACGIPALISVGIVSDLLKGKGPLYRYRQSYARGMSPVRDWFDWLGGYPFEVARPEEVFDFCRERGFSLQRMRTVGGGWGCNEFVFRRSFDEHETDVC